MELKKISRFVHEVSSNDLHEFIKSKINRKCVAFSYEEGSGVFSRFVVRKLTEVEANNKHIPPRYYSEQWEKYKAGKLPTLRPGIILDGLCEDGHIEPGVYLVVHEWK
jgi:hypothetical protein